MEAKDRGQTGRRRIVKRFLVLTVALCFISVAATTAVQLRASIEYSNSIVKKRQV